MYEDSSVRPNFDPARASLLGGAYRARDVGLGEVGGGPAHLRLHRNSLIDGPNDGLAPVVDVNVFHTDVLVAATVQAAVRLDLHAICS